MNKVSKTLMTTVATVAVVGAGQVVHAEDVQPKEVKGTEATQSKATVTKEEVATSQTKVDTATGRYASFGVVTSLPDDIIDSFWY
uniref:hypothetical protein n=1 Tax=Bifidobacterium sp. RTP21102st3_E2_RTP21102_210122 TaxID=3143206 RepID=UPI0034A228BB